MKSQHGWAFPDADEFMLNELHADGTYQASHLRMALQYVTDWTYCIDGGAHVGTWSKILSTQFACVIAVEPCQDTLEALRVNLAGCENVVIRAAALGAKAGKVSMVLDGKGLIMKNTGARHVGTGSDVIRERIDDWRLSTCGLLKLDVEGSEVDALKGAEETLRRCHPIVLFEDKFLWRRFNYPRLAPHQFLQKLGYRHLVKAGVDEIWGPVS